MRRDRGKYYSSRFSYWLSIYLVRIFDSGMKQWEIMEQIVE